MVCWDSFITVNPDLFGRIVFTCKFLKALSRENNCRVIKYDNSLTELTLEITNISSRE